MKFLFPILILDYYILLCTGFFITDTNDKSSI